MYCDTNSPQSNGHSVPAVVKATATQTSIRCYNRLALYLIGELAAFMSQFSTMDKKCPKWDSASHIVSMITPYVGECAVSLLSSARQGPMLRAMQFLTEHKEVLSFCPRWPSESSSTSEI